MNRYNRWLVGFGAAGVLTAIGITLWVILRRGAEGSEDQEDNGPPLNVSVFDFSSEYADNPIQADTMYQGRRLILRGIVERIDSEYVYLTTTKESPISCKFRNFRDAVSLVRWKSATVSGICPGGSASLIDCTLIEADK